MRRAALLALVALLCGCAARVATPAAMPASIGGLVLLGSATVARTPDGPLAHFGGISGMDRDPASGQWLLLSDDRSEYAPARFYPAGIEVDERGVHDIRIGPPVTLLQPDGRAYPDVTRGGEVPDPEALRIDPRDGSLLWSSEGDRRLGLDPFVRRATRDGRFAGRVDLPPMLRVHADREQGVRNNLSVEGLAFAPDGRGLWVAMEAPLYEDGDLPTLAHGALARFSLVDRDSRTTAQYAYPVDPIPPFTPASGRADNGVSEVLVIGNGRLLVIERSGHETTPGVFRFAIRLYEADAADATDVRDIPSLREVTVRPMKKRLLLDLTRLALASGDVVDNIEAAAWGPRLRNGHATLLLAADDNFAAWQANQFIALEVLP